MGINSKIVLTMLLAVSAGTRAQLVQPAPRVEDYPDPLEADQRKILAQITDHAMKYSSELPDFTCEEITRHNVDQKGTGQYWRLTDTVSGELSYSGHKGVHKVLKVNGKEETGDRHPRAAFNSPDVFGGLLTWIFDPKSKTSFKWNSWSALEKRRTYVFAYTVAQENSQFAVTKAREPLGFYGNIYADAETGQIIRINLVGQTPAKATLRDVSFDVDYALTKIGDKEYPLPAKANLRLRDAKILIWDEIEFHHYRQFGAADEQFSKRP